ncbi:unnamed protein product [Oikopleura dioica]|uniref:Uncharacterized protein n=1 Tax=Oikopleura dioica TaxID=34765 RepID=E4XNK3_OIKDI|nr:unnamed protein product [Oikopleura dioica]
MLKLSKQLFFRNSRTVLGF